MDPYHLSWSDLSGGVAKLAALVKEDFDPDILIAVARGGFVPARLLANHFPQARLASVGMTYADSDRSRPEAYGVPSDLVRWERALIVEDCVESGRSLRAAVGRVREEVQDARSAAIWVTAHTSFQPDYSLGSLPRPPRFPWEV